MSLEKTKSSCYIKCPFVFEKEEDLELLENKTFFVVGPHNIMMDAMGKPYDTNDHDVRVQQVYSGKIQHDEEISSKSKKKKNIHKRIVMDDGWETDDIKEGSHSTVAHIFKNNPLGNGFEMVIVQPMSTCTLEQGVPVHSPTITVTSSSTASTSPYCTDAIGYFPKTTTMEKVMDLIIKRLLQQVNT